MALRPVFISLPPNDKHLLVREELVNFEFFSGFAIEQKRKSVKSLHRSIDIKYPDAKILEVSTKSSHPIGQRLSAFNLTINIEGQVYPIENVFQSAKVFENGGPFWDLLGCTPIEAKKDLRLKTSGALKGFRLFDGFEDSEGQEFPLTPQTFFYDYIYIQALAQHEELWDTLVSFDHFTDIEFNQQKSLNCQARTVALFVALCKNDKIQDSLEDPELFKTSYQHIDGYLTYGHESKVKTRVSQAKKSGKAQAKTVATAKDANMALFGGIEPQ